MAIRYCSSLAVGGGDGTFLSPWTLQELADGTLAGDEGRIMADGVYSPTATIDFDTVAGTAASYPVFIGADASGNVTGARPIISGASLLANSDLFYLNIANQRAAFYNLILTGAKRYGINSNTFGSVIVVDNCRFQFCTTMGFYTIQGSNRFLIINSEFIENGYGCGSTNGFRFALSTVYGCLFYKNTTAGLICANDNKIVKCYFIRNGIGVSGNAALSRSLFDNNVFLLNTSHGIKTRADTLDEQIFIVNNIFRRNGGYAINTNTSDIPRIFLYNNCFSNNTSGNVDINGGVAWGEGHVLADPLFVDETDGSEDITLQSGSPCLNAGLNPVGY